jgi:hypothetical protein
LQRLASRGRETLSFPECGTPYTYGLPHYATLGLPSRQITCSGRVYAVYQDRPKLRLTLATILASLLHAAPPLQQADPTLHHVCVLARKETG